MNEKKYVTWEMFEKYHESLMKYIRFHDELVLNGVAICPKCGELTTSDKCEHCASKTEE